MATYGDLAFDSRVQREAISLAEAGHQVTLLCVEPGGDLPPTLTTAVTVISRYPTGRPVAPLPIRWRGPLGLVGRALDRARWMVVYRRDADNKFIILFTKPKEEAGKGYLKIDKNLWMYDPNTGKWERRTERERIAGTNSRREDFDVRPHGI